MDEAGETKQLIIAHALPESQRRLAALLEDGGIFSVCHMTHDGLDCLEQIAAIRPDLVILSSVLDQMDGLEVLRRAKELSLDTKFLFITTYKNFLADHAALAGADHCILEPCPDQVLAQRAQELVLPPKERFSDEEIDRQTVRVLHAISAPTNLKGYQYAIDSVRILNRDPELVTRRRVTQGLYGAVARLHGISNPKQVERCLRTLTERIFTDSSMETLEKYFNCVYVQHSDIPNTAFLQAVAGHVATALEAEVSAGQAAQG